VERHRWHAHRLRPRPGRRPVVARPCVARCPMAALRERPGHGDPRLAGLRRGGRLMAASPSRRIESA
jgi:hypothetical protein